MNSRRRMFKLVTVSLISAIVVGGCSQDDQPSSQERADFSRPNIVLIVADDMG